jgi:D-galactarolactone cycloisomerase
VKFTHATWLLVGCPVRPMENATTRTSMRVGLIVELQTDAGLAGVGEAYPAEGRVDFEPIVDAFARSIAPNLVGASPLSPPSVSVDALPSRHARAALSAIDIACWDIRAQAAGVPIWEALGGAVRQSVRPYASGLPYRDVDDQLAEDRDAIASALDDGFRGVKMRVGRDLTLDKTRIEAAAGLLRESGVLAADANQSASLDGAAALASTLHDVSALWFEEPFLPERLDLYGRLRGATEIPLSGGEASTSAAEAIAHSGAGLDVVQPDLGGLGGFTELVRLIDGGVGTRAVVFPHVWGTGVAVRAALHALAWLPTPAASSTTRALIGEPLFEVDATGNPLLDGCLDEPLDLSAQIRASGVVSCDLEGTGLGAALDRAFVDRHLLAARQIGLLV